MHENIGPPMDESVHFASAPPAERINSATESPISKQVARNFDPIPEHPKNADPLIQFLNIILPFLEVKRHKKTKDEEEEKKKEPVSLRAMLLLLFLSSITSGVNDGLRDTSQGNRKTAPQSL